MQAADIPVKFTIPFGNAAGGAYIRAVPTASQIGILDGAASLTDGFPPLTMTPEGAGGVPPFGQDMNGLLKQITAWSRWMNAGGTVPYDATFQTAIGGYPKGATVSSVSVFGRIWLSLTDNNVADPDTGGAGWAQWEPGNYYAADTGAVNAYACAFAPAYSMRLPGTVLRVMVLHTNTGASTLDPGTGAASIVRRDGSALIGGELVANQIAEFIDNGTRYELNSMAPASNAVVIIGADTASAVTPASLKATCSNLLAGNGYQKLPGGLILQWMAVSCPGGTSVLLDLPIPFVTAFLNCVTSYGASFPPVAALGAEPYSLAQVKVSNSASTTNGGFLQAVGY